MKILTVEYAPGGSSKSHRHDAHAFVYVFEGAITMQVSGSEPVTVTAGNTFYESPNDIHLVSKNASDIEAAKFVVFTVKENGAPVVLPVQ
ncbi:cupin domain-containing protein [Pseudomonadota bacterium]